MTFSSRQKVQDVLVGVSKPASIDKNPRENKLKIPQYNFWSQAKVEEATVLSI